MLQKPIVIKPYNGSLSNGLSTDITDQYQIQNAYQKAASHSPSKVLIQEQVNGIEYRIVVYYGEVVCVYLKEPAFVIGDGKRTIKQLLRHWNEEVDRIDSLFLKKCEMQASNWSLLEKNNLFETTIPTDGDKVYLKNEVSLSSGTRYQYVEEEEIPAATKRLFIDLADKFQSPIVGYDVICDDIKKDLTENPYWLLEMNSNPFFVVLKHQKGWEKRNLPKLFLQKLFANTL